MSGRLHSFFQHLSLQVKLTCVFIATILCASVLSLYLYNQTSQAISAVEQIYESNISLSGLKDALDATQTSLYGYLNGDYASLNEYYLSEQQLSTQAAALNGQVTDQSMKLIEKNIRNLVESYLERTDSAVAGHRGTDMAKYSVDYEEATRIYGYLEAYIDTLNEERFQQNTSNYKLLAGTQRYTQWMNLAMLLLTTLAELLILSIFIRRATDPLVELSERASKVGRGNLDLPPLEVASQDEVGQVTQAFNTMTVRLNEYLRRQQEQLKEENRLKEEQLRLETHLKDAQLGALQAQINPHFLYNTLNAGSHLAMMEGAEQTCLFLERVAEFFRYNLHRSGRDVSLREEVEQVENYIYIMNTRYAGELSYSRQQEGRMPAVSLPGMILQPLVENAIDHGLRELEGEKRLTLSIQEEPDRVVVSVMDNGAGFPPETARRLLEPTAEQSPAQENRHGVGITNVLSRLRLYYGREDVMEIRSAPGAGAEVRILIPKGGDHYVSDHAGG